MSIPTTLIQRRQWVSWAYEDDPAHPDKPKKMPKNPRTGGNAQSTNAQTWGSYAQAVAAAEGRRHAGVGFVFTQDDPFVGGDLDGCRDPETGIIADWAAPWVERLLPVAYIEVSPSQRGLKFIVRGDLPKALKRSIGDHEGIELYATGRYFTITAQRLPGCATDPQPAQDILDDLVAHFDPPAATPVENSTGDEPYTARTIDDVQGGGWHATRARSVEMLIKLWAEEKIAHARDQVQHAPNGTKHNRRLEMGRLLGGVIAAAPRYLSETEAERILYDAQRPEAHGGQERKAITDGIAIGKDSPLPLPKLPTDHDPIVKDGIAYCPACDTRIRQSKATIPYPGTSTPGWYCPRCKFPMVWPLEAHDPGPGDTNQARAVTHDDDTVTTLPLLIPATQLGQLPPAVPLIPDLLFRNRLHVIFGAPGSGKSYLALDMACTVAQYAPVVYLAAEAIEDYEARVEAWQAHHRASVERLFFWREPIRLASMADVEAFTTDVRALGPVAIFVDPLADCMSGLVESTQEGMSVAIQALNHIRRGTGAGVGIVHHTGWDDQRERGSSVLRAAARVVVRIEQRDDGLINVSCVKKNQGKPFAPRSFRLVPAGEMGAVVPVTASRVLQLRNDRPTERMLRVMEALTTEPLRDGASHKALIDDTGFPASTMNRIITSLADSGYIVKQDRGRNQVAYLLTQLGAQTLEEIQIAGNALPASGRASSDPLPRTSLNWIVELPNSFQRQDALLPPSSTSVPKSSSTLFQNPPPPIGGGGGRGTDAGNGSENDLVEHVTTYTAIPGFEDDEPLDGETPAPSFAQSTAERLRQLREARND
jgi:predicted transcriptional regulator